MRVCPHCRRDVGDVRFCPYDGTPVAHLGGGPLEGRELTQGDTIEGRYEIVAELGRGGMAWCIWPTPRTSAARWR